ncbi:disease resistance RPP13-like protein 4 [Quercus lobata]|uniref:Disease resistance RPP13-like protein 4 n=1 Tax=Quercus lobata TaxID=97700 RepID=A0A7N2LU31_QUELO|nr:disease resistance RPP13-like protein 4 [Quercus lobata]
MSRHISSTSSFESPYVSLDLLAYLNSGKKTPFHVFNDVVMPEFQCHLLKLKQLLPPKDMNGTEDNTSRTVRDEEEDDSNCNGSHAIVEEIQKDLDYINKACHKLKDSADRVDEEIQRLILQRLDDAFRERTEEALANSPRINKLKRTKDVVSMLKNQICSSPQLSSDSLLDKQPEVNINDQKITKSLTLKRIKEMYNGLNEIQKKCLLCFSVFPENETIKKKVLIHWWVGEEFIDSLNGDGKTAEETGNDYFKEFISKGIIEPVKKKGRQSSENCKMQSSVRDAIIKLAEKDEFVSFDSKGNPNADFSSCSRVCLVKTEEGSSLRDFTYIYHHLKHENIQTLFNVNEPELNFRVDRFSKMKNLKVLQLGRWKASARQLVEVEDTEFLKGLKKMKQLRYFSLRGISRITELPNSICELSNLRILNLNGCDNLEKLPDGIGSLKQLTHLDMSDCFLISHMPKGLASLLELQVLKGFVIGKQSPSGLYCKLADLARLKHLRKLSIHVDRTSLEAEKELNSFPQFRKLQSLSVAWWSSVYNASTSTTTNVAFARFQRMVSRENSMKALAKIPRILSREKSMPTTPGPTSLPVDLHKLGLQYFHGSKMPDWLKLLNLENLKKLYIRGGELSDLRLQEDHSWAVECLRLKSLSKLKMDWPELQQQLFPKLKYAEKEDCPQLSSFPSDDNGEWIWNAADTKQA